jgi:hypothetical protein
MTRTTCLPAMACWTFGSAMASFSRSSFGVPRSFAVHLHHDFGEVFLGQFGVVGGPGWRNTGPSLPSSSQISCARYGANGASISASFSASRPARRRFCGSSAYSTFTSSMMLAMQVLKCQRDSKSSVIFLMVWCSLRRTLRSAFAASRPRCADHIARGEAVDAAEEAVNAFGAFVAPVDFLFGRRGETARTCARYRRRTVGQHRRRPPRCPSTSTSWRRRRSPCPA